MSKLNFDFVVFDWKGTIEKKGGNKKERERRAVEHVDRRFSGFGDLYYHERKVAKENHSEKSLKKSTLVKKCLSKLNVDQQTKEEMVTTFNQVRKLF